ncbi:LysR family transcriptional regulator [Marinomonas sp. 42_23_T18]|nr:LysR family transcriptional regulator [Marinomonas sp. 42_23_T18]
MDLHQIDLNLFILFDALYRHQSVSLAAEELCISQSAFSHALSRLRKRMNDELFIRVNNQMQPTPRAQEIAKHLKQALPFIHNAINTSDIFDASIDTSEFKISATDYTEFSLLPRLVGQINQQAPKVTLTVIGAKASHPLTHLENNDVDFALGFSHEIETSSIIECFTWLTDSYCTVARKDHPALKQGLDLETFLSLSHVRISPWGEKQGVVDQVLAQHKLTRHVALQLPSVLVAPHTIINSDLILTMPRLIAEQVSKQIDIQIFTPPIPIPDYHLNIYWHKINSDKASFKWMKGLFQSLS